MRSREVAESGRVSRLRVSSRGLVACGGAAFDGSA